MSRRRHHAAITWGWLSRTIRLPALVLLVLLAACGSGDTLDSSSNRHFLVTLSSDIRSTNPGVNRDANTDTVMMHIVEGLVAYREDGTPGLLLAESMEVSDDGLEYLFTLRDGLKFHNGAPVTSAEVVWSWRRYLDPATGWTCLSDFDGTNGNRVEEVRAVDRLKVLFRLNRPQPLFLSQMAAINCGAGAILHPSSVDAQGQWRNPVATGPYRLVEWKRGDSIHLEAFPEYVPRTEPRDGNTGAKQALEKRLTFLVIRDAASRLAALDKGQIDVMPEVPAAEMRQIRHIKRVRLVSAPMLGSYGILVQDQDPLLADGRIRQAIALAIDRDALADIVNEGTAVGNPSIVATASVFHPPTSILGGKPDLERSRALLQEAGYDGSPIVLSTNRRYPAMFNQALLVQAMCRQVGLNIRIEVLEWAAQMDRWRAGKFQLLSFGFSARADAAASYSFILGDRARNPSRVWDNPKALALMEQSLRTGDGERRRELFNQLHLLMLKDVPYIGLFSPADINAVREDVDGFESWMFGRARYWGVHRVREGAR
jgi:peptide/nickel transport system substrate-binding protein